MDNINELRKYKIFNMAIFDLVGTFIIIFFIHLYMWLNVPKKNKENRNYIQYLISLLLLFITGLGIGVIFHYIFKVNSALSRYIGLLNV